MAAGVEPGVSVSVKTSNDCIYTTLAFSAISRILSAYSGESCGRRQCSEWEGLMAVRLALICMV